MQKVYCHWSPSLGQLEDTAYNVWGTNEYKREEHLYESVIFFGLYSARDYEILFKHQGKKYVLWGGSDIKNFETGLAFGDGKLLELSERFQGVNWILSRWINENCQNWVENEVERKALAKMGIASIICPSFMGKIADYEDCYTPATLPSVYVSSGNNRQEEYGFGLVEEIAAECRVKFHLYGADWITKRQNVVVHGRVPKEFMNAEIKKMQCGLRLNKFDGFSEVTAKSILWGQHPITRKEFNYPYIDAFKTNRELVDLLNKLHEKKESHPHRQWYIDNINKYPWNLRK